MRFVYRSRTGAIGSRFPFKRMVGETCAAAAVLVGVSASASFGAEYNDPAGAFTIAYDAAVWTVTSEGDGDFTIDCVAEACARGTAGCSGSRLWVPLASIGRLTREFDARDTERAILDSLAKEKAEREKGKAPDAEDVPPQVVKPYALNHRRDGHPVYESEYKVSFDGPLTRFLSFSTGARSHSIAIVCHAQEDRLSVWRPRIEALIDGFKPTPDPFWLRWLARIGL